MATPQKNRDVSGYTDSPKGAAPIGKSCFLGIGIDAYQHFSKLHNAVRDMEAVRNLDRWVGADDKLIIYYGGHGHLNRHKRGFWVPVDAEEKDK
jgi:hypothetical protein